MHYGTRVFVVQWYKNSGSMVYYIIPKIQWCNMVDRTIVDAS